MNTLKEKLDAYQEQPDPALWQRLSQTLQQSSPQKRPPRQWLMGSIALLIVAAAIYGITHIGNLHPAPRRHLVLMQQQPQPMAYTPQAATPIPAMPATEAGAAAPAAATAQPLPKPSAPAAPAMPAAEAGAAAPAASHAQPQPQPCATAAPTMPTAEISPAQQQPQPSAPATATAATPAPQADTLPPAPAAKAQPVTPTSELTIWIPNAFAPNDPDPDVRRFTIVPSNEADIQSYEIYIYSRRGRLVYHSKEIGQSWDGTANGADQPMGTYVYLIEYKDAHKGIQHARGTVTLLR